MSNSIFTMVTGHETLEELIDAHARLIKQLEFMMQGNLGSKNIREVGDFVVGPNTFQSRDGMVGISSLVTGNNEVRFWAGSVDRYNAPFRVYHDGKVVMTNLVATGAQISGAITLGPGSFIQWSSVNSDPVATNAAATAGNALSIAQQIANGTYTGGTFINGQMIYSPEIYTGYLHGGTIEGGEIISNSTIDVTTNINLGNSIILNGTAQQQTVVAYGIGDITFDRASDRVVIAALNGLHLGENQLILGGVNVYQKLNSLQPAGNYVRAASPQNMLLQYMSVDNTIEVWVEGDFKGDIQLV